MEHVTVHPRRLARLAEVIGDQRTHQLVESFGPTARTALAGRAVIHVNSTMPPGAASPRSCTAFSAMPSTPASTPDGW